MNKDDKLRYPIGKFIPQDTYTPAEIKTFISQLANFPDELATLVSTFSNTELDTPYREGSWTARQVIHHLADSHMNSYIRVKWTLTENNPTIKAYNEKDWASTPDNRLDPSVSIAVLKALHSKWVALLSLLTTTDLQRYYIHPETQKSVPLERLIALYAWHGKHHIGHLQLIKSR